MVSTPQRVGRSPVTLTRLRDRAQFTRVAAKGKRWAAPGLVLQAARQSSETADAERHAGVGFTVSRRVGGAVVRNRVRRRLKAAARQVMPYCARDGLDYVLIGRVASRRRGFADLVADLATALKRVGAWRQAPDCQGTQP